MRIESFEFCDHDTGWRLKEARFDGLNLLVGLSGAGKSKVLRALDDVRRLGLGEDVEAGRWSWVLACRHGGRRFEWSGVLARVDGSRSFLVERLLVDDALVIERADGRIRFRDQKTPRLNHRESILTLFADEEEPELIRSGLALCFDVDRETSGPVLVPDTLDELFDEGQAFEGSAEQWRHRPTPHAPDLKSPLALGLLMLRRKLPEVYAQLVDSYRDVFHTVEDIAVETVRMPSGNVLEIRLKERGADGWIAHRDISRGMLRTLAALRALLILPAGSLLTIDEFENSLGVNCLPAVTRLIDSRADCQFILTSHHPYVIDHIPIDAWKLVRRRGSRVELLPARDLPALAGESQLDAFTRLINTPEYEDGID